MFFSVRRLRTSDKQIPVNPVVVVAAAAAAAAAVVVEDSNKKIKISCDQTVSSGRGCDFRGYLHKVQEAMFLSVNARILDGLLSADVHPLVPGKIYHTSKIVLPQTGLTFHTFLY